jgi:hypothetical protein
MDIEVDNAISQRTATSAKPEVGSVTHSDLGIFCVVIVALFD